MSDEEMEAERDAQVTYEMLVEAEKRVLAVLEAQQQTDERLEKVEAERDSLRERVKDLQYRLSLAIPPENRGADARPDFFNDDEVSRITQENRSLRAALEQIAERTHHDTFIARIAREALDSNTPKTEDTEFPPGTVGRTDGLTDDMGG